jgi:hypothetical protein
VANGDVKKMSWAIFIMWLDRPFDASGMADTSSIEGLGLLPAIYDRLGMYPDARRQLTDYFVSILAPLVEQAGVIKDCSIRIFWPKFFTEAERTDVDALNRMLDASFAQRSFLPWMEAIRAQRLEQISWLPDLKDSDFEWGAAGKKTYTVATLGSGVVIHVGE